MIDQTTAPVAILYAEIPEDDPAKRVSPARKRVGFNDASVFDVGGNLDDHSNAPAARVRPTTLGGFPMSGHSRTKNLSESGIVSMSWGPEPARRTVHFRSCGGEVENAESDWWEAARRREGV